MRWRRCVRPRSRHARRRLFREPARRARGLLRKMPIKAGRAACGSSCRLLGAAGELFENGAAELLQLAELRQIVLKFLVEKLRVLRAELVAKNHVAQLDGVRKERVLLQFFKGGGGVVMVHGGSWPNAIAGLYPLGEESGTRQDACPESGDCRAAPQRCDLPGYSSRQRQYRNCWVEPKRCLVAAMAASEISRTETFLKPRAIRSSTSVDSPPPTSIMAASWPGTARSMSASEVSRCGR